ncbi:MAG: MmcQ/YjbR family DNA-binding protein [Chthonomonas sp.]|nr:MmcQ/YjbR family DNA-binding protein [Chthonomonas sp.]
MQLFDQVRALCLSLPGAYEKLSHGSPCFFVEKGNGRIAVWLRSSLPIQEGAIAENPEIFFRPPYVGPSGWIGICLDQGISEEELKNWIEQAHSLAQPARRPPAKERKAR